MAHTNPRPNILYLTADQQKASATSVYGNPLISCPFTERLAAEGITFGQAYTASTICTPSRASVMTGVHPLVHQVTCWQNNAPWNLPQLPELFAADGYYTAAAGHFEQGRDLGRGWHVQADLREAGELHEALEYKYSHGRSDCGWSAGGLNCPADQGHSAILGNRAVEMIDDAVKAGAPFFIHISFNDPHPPYFVPPPFDSLVDPAGIKLPNQGGGPRRPAWQLQALEEISLSSANDYDLKKIVAVYYGMIAYVDTQMERLYQILSKKGLLDDTWIVFASDHGDFMSEKGLFEKCEVPYECLTHVPLIIAAPTGSNAPRNRRIDGLVSTVDCFTTMLRIAGLEIPHYAQGKDLIEWIEEGTEDPLHDCVFAQVGDYHGQLKTTLPTGTFESGRRKSLVQSGRTVDYSYLRDDQYGDEAYDLRTDPKELCNVLNDGSGSEPSWVCQMQDRINAWERKCTQLREELGVIPGNRGY